MAVNYLICRNRCLDNIGNGTFDWPCVLSSPNLHAFNRACLYLTMNLIVHNAYVNINMC